MLHMFDGENWTLFSDKLGKIRSIDFADDGTIWCAGEEGVFHNGSGTWVQIGVLDGLPGDVAYILHRDPTGRLWAGTSQGASHFDPLVDRTVPHVRIVSDQNQIELPSHGFARVEFDGRDYWHQTAPQRFLYSYQLDEQPWSNYFSDPRATLSGLSAGVPILCLLLIAAGNYRRPGEMVIELQKSRREAEKALETNARYGRSRGHRRYSERRVDERSTPAHHRRHSECA